MHRLLKGVMSTEELSYLKQVFTQRPHALTRGMEKVYVLKMTEPTHPDFNQEFLTFLNNIISDKVGISTPYRIVGDNFYKHTTSYYPHCDALEESAWLNIVFPIERYEVHGEQKFIIFDQMWTGGGITWTGETDLNGDFYSNKKANSRPSDSTHFVGNTHKPLPDNIWQQLEFNGIEQDYLFGMSGTIYDWIPGDIIVFDSQHIHATGKMQSEAKLGLTVRIAYP